MHFRYYFLFQELAGAKGNILENKELLDSLNKTKASSITIADSLSESVRLQTSLDQVYSAKYCITENSQFKYFDITSWTKFVLFRVLVYGVQPTFNNISVISWRSVLLVEETGENHRSVASPLQTLSHNVVSNTPCHDQTSNSQR